MTNPTSLTVEQRHIEAAQKYFGWPLPPADSASVIDAANHFARFEADHLTSTDRLRDALRLIMKIHKENRCGAQYSMAAIADEALTSAPAPSGEREALENVISTMSRTIDIADNIIAIHCGLDTPAEWNEAIRKVVAARAALQGHVA